MKGSEKEQMVQRHETTTTRLQQGQVEGLRMDKASKWCKGGEKKYSKKWRKEKGINNREIKT